MDEKELAMLQEFKEYNTKIEYLNSALGVLYWDMRVGMPKNGVDYRSEVIGYLSGELYKLQTGEKMKEYINYFEGLNSLELVNKVMVEKARKNFDQTNKIPEERYKAYTILTSKAETVWEEAKNKSDFSIFLPYLQKIVDFNKEFIDYWGYKDNKYDTLLDFYEPGITVEKLDTIFGELREAIVSLLGKIQSSKDKPEDSFLYKKAPVEVQDKFCRYILKKMGYNFDSGRLDETEHPFTIEFNNKDVRITTHYYEEDLKSGLFSCIHEGGHALYEQDISDDLKGTLLGNGVSMGVHESQSRFYENIVGRSKEFWTSFYPELIQTFPQFKDISLEEFYKGINTVKPSLIRTEADELTYSLHIIIRYEIEKALINGEIEASDLPRIWREKYKEYIGIEPKDDREGVLQDIHWAGGSFGYFPSYALGNLYGAQFLNQMIKDVPDLKAKLESGELAFIHEYLKNNIHKFGSVFKPEELIKKVTGEELKAEYFIKYLNEKYSEIYNF